LISHASGAAEHTAVMAGKEKWWHSTVTDVITA